MFAVEVRSHTAVHQRFRATIRPDKIIPRVAQRVSDLDTKHNNTRRRFPLLACHIARRDTKTHPGSKGTLPEKFRPER